LTTAATPTDPPHGTAPAASLVLASATVLFQELALIRWLPSQVRVLAYFPNLVLLSAFLGLGLGCLRAGRRSLLWSWPAALLLTVATTLLLGRVAFTQDSKAEHLYLLYYDLSPHAPVIGDVRPAIVVSFLLGTLCFVGLGQLVAQRLEDFRFRGKALRGYALDLTGSLLGVGAFAAVSFARWFPVAWFLLLAGAACLLPRRPLARAAAALTCVAAALLAHANERAIAYSPYYAIGLDLRRAPDRVALLANRSLHQEALRLRRGAAVEPDLAWIRDGYHLPYAYLAQPPARALVIGAGTGNDVSVLLDHGASWIDAVEIDPVILDVGRRLHPDRPYDSPRVHPRATDARAFLHACAVPGAAKYDLVVFGTLDSLTRLSALSSARLDTFVYTSEALREARDCLSPTGGLVLYFMVATDYIHQRLGGMITQAFGQVPLVLERDHRLFNRIYMAGPAFAVHDGAARTRDAETALRTVRRGTELPRDDWPFLYLSRRGVGAFYLSVMAMLAAIALAAVALGSPELRASLRTHRGVDVEMFLFGMAFLLLETRAVTEMNLAWGATWVTSAVVFGSILAVALLATLCAARWRVRFALAAACLTLSLVALYLLPAARVLAVGGLSRLALSVPLVGTPVFFAALLFGTLYRDRVAVAGAFGWNLLGAMAGGLLETTSMAFGLKALALVALLAYLLAWAWHARTRTATR